MENLRLKLALLQKLLDAAPPSVFSLETSLDLVELANKQGFIIEIEKLKQKYSNEAETNPQTKDWTEAEKYKAVVRATARDFFNSLDTNQICKLWY